MTNAIQNDSVTFRATALAFSTQKVAAMCAKVKASFERRDVFEVSQGLSLAEKNSYTKARNAMLKANIAVSRFMLALHIEPSNVIERSVCANAMFNAKALDKVTELAVYSVGVGATRMQRVTKAFIACALIATDKGIAVITNDVNRRFLCSAGFTSFISDQDLIDHLDELRLRSMSSGAETQSSQTRNVLDVLRLGQVCTTLRARDSIAIDGAHDFFAQFRADYMKASAPIAVTVTDTVDA